MSQTIKFQGANTMIFYLFTIICMLSAACFMNGAQQTHMSHSDIADVYLTSFITSEAPKAEVAFKAKTPLEEALAKYYSVKKLGDYEVRSLVFSLFDRASGSDVTGTHSPLSILAHDLNLFAYQSKKVDERDKHLFAILNRTETVFGEAVLAHMLGNPISDIDELRARQAFIKLLVEDDALFNELQALVVRVKEKQDDILFNWRSIDDSARQVLADQYFTNSYLQRFNTNEYVHECILKILPLSVVTAGAAWTAYQWHKLIYLSWLCAHNFGLLNKTTMQVMWPTGVLTLYLGYGIYQVQEAFKLTAAMGTETIEHMFNGMAGMSLLVREADRVQSIAKRHTSVNNALSSHMREMCAGHDEKYERVLQLLATSTFNGAYARVSMFSGRVKVAYLLMQDVKDEFIPFMQLIGTIDAYLSIAKFYKEHQNTNAPYSLVEFIEQEAPYINAQGFWNPMLDASTVVTNDIILGGDNARAALVTGSNTGGKSTIAIQGLTTTLLLAQTLGIAPVVRLVMTPFDYIATLLKVQDNVLTGHSHFLSEVEYAAKIHAAINQLPAHSKAFLAVDELFEGTVAQTGSKALYDFAKKLADNDHLLFVIATQHQIEPTRLEQATDGVIKNYKVDVIRLTDGTIVRPYKLEEGVSQVNIGDDLLQAAFNQTR